MARLTNKQLDIVVDEIFEQVSKPIIEANNKALDSVEIEDDEYLIDIKKYELLDKKRNEIDNEMTLIVDKYNRKSFNDYTFSWNPMGCSKSYIKTQKKKLVLFKEYPSKNDIEKQVILAGNKEIPELIELLVKKLQ